MSGMVVTRRLVRGLLCAGAAAAIGLLAGCGDGSRSNGGLGNGGGAGGALNAGGRLGGEQSQASAVCGADLSGLSQAVYVSTRGSDEAGCGKTTTAACKSIAQGIASCAGAGCGVLVRHGLYPTSATIALREGVNVYGSCLFDDEPDRAYRTTIEANPPAGAPAILAVSVNAPTTVQGLVVVGKDETAGSTASLTMVVRNSKGLTVAHNVLSSGQGGRGLSGTTPGSVGGGSEGKAGSDGGVGGQSCTSGSAAPGTAPGQGGQGLIDTTLAGTWSWSDYAYSCPAADIGAAGQASGDGKPGGALGVKGDKGYQCVGRPHDYPGAGGPGVDGPTGGCGAAAQPSPWSAGSFDGTSWMASKGDDGAVGAVGAGGGGGGAGGPCVTHTQGYVYNGLPGGGGGGGGCGGGAGTAGRQGGASIPLLLADSSIGFDAALNSIVPGPGGDGGNGGSATSGGTGGKGGLGQLTGQTYYLAFYCGGLGASGGSGGYGGAGSAGAAGHGGPSIGIALAGASAAPSSVDAVYATQPGLPGRGGTGASAAPPDGSCTGAAGSGGAPGVGAATFNLGTPPRNFLAFGQVMKTGESRTSLNGQVQLTLQSGNLCLVRQGNTLWCSLQAGWGPGDELVWQPEGDLCLINRNGNSANCFAPSATRGSYLVVLDEGRAVVLDGSANMWSVP